jgi:hypothetical protein
MVRSFLKPVEKKKKDINVNATIYGRQEHADNKEIKFTPTHFFCNTNTDDIITDEDLKKGFTGIIKEGNETETKMRIKLDIAMKIDQKFLTLEADAM